MTDEAFAPVASFIAIDDFEETLCQVDETEYGLQAGVFAHDIKRVFQAIRNLHFGGVIINDLLTGLVRPYLSGLARRRSR
jgi:acyl-CoA reductase-like NAD-dependent aldehyde dehydrogenase